MSADTDVERIIELLSFGPYTYEGGGTAGWNDLMRRQLAEYLVRQGAVRTDDLEPPNDLGALRDAIKNQIK